MFIGIWYATLCHYMQKCTYWPLTLYRDKERSNQMSPPLKLMGMDQWSIIAMVSFINIQSPPPGPKFQVLTASLTAYICGGGQGGSPTPASLPPYPHFPPPRPPLPSPSSPTSLPLEYFSRPHRKKKKNRSSHHITFHFSAWIIIKALRL